MTEAVHADRRGGSQAPRLTTLLMLLLAGCASARLPSIATPINGPRDLLLHIASHTDSLQNARVRTRVSMEIEGVRQKATSIVFAERPSDLKMEVNGPLGVSIMSARFRDDSLKVYLPGDNGYLEGSAARVLYQVTGMNLAYYDIQDVILGIPTIGRSAEHHITGFRTTADHHIVDLDLGLFRKRMWVDRVRVVVTREDILDVDGVLLSRLQLNQYETRNGCVLPGRIRIDQGINHIVWSTESLEINQGISPSVFELRMPPGVSRLE
jgi:outer membrane lipoprotein-sorting protein